MLRAGPTMPPLLRVIMGIWVLSPFIALTVAAYRAERWSVAVRESIDWVMAALSLGSMAIYAVDAVGARQTPRALVFVLLPPISWLLMAGATPILAHLIARRLNRRQGHPLE